MYEKLYPLLPIDGIFSLFLFGSGGKVQKMLHAIKYSNEPELAYMLGRWMGSRLEEEGLQYTYDLIVPVPLHKSKLQKRGYNQSAYFAKGLGDHLGIAVDEHLVSRNTATETQTRKTRLRRWHNVDTVFTVSKTDQVAGKRILLIDDVITTGATIISCGKGLMDAGCSSLSLGAIASA